MLQILNKNILATDLADPQAKMVLNVSIDLSPPCLTFGVKTVHKAMGSGKEMPFLLTHWPLEDVLIFQNMQLSTSHYLNQC